MNCFPFAYIATTSSMIIFLLSVCFYLCDCIRSLVNIIFFCKWGPFCCLYFSHRFFAFLSMPFQEHPERTCCCWSKVVIWEYTVHMCGGATAVKIVQKKWKWRENNRILCHIGCSNDKTTIYVLWLHSKLLYCSFNVWENWSLGTKLPRTKLFYSESFISMKACNTCQGPVLERWSLVKTTPEIGIFKGWLTGEIKVGQDRLRSTVRMVRWAWDTRTRRLRVGAMSYVWGSIQSSRGLCRKRLRRKFTKDGLRLLIAPQIVHHRYLPCLKVRFTKDVVQMIWQRNYAHKLLN